MIARVTVTEVVDSVFVFFTFKRLIREVASKLMNILAMQLIDMHVPEQDEVNAHVPHAHAML